MTNYVFESMTQAQANLFAGTDNLFFLSATAASLGVSDTSQTQLNNEAITLTSGSQSLTFSAASINTASTNNRVTFINGDVLVTGLAGTTATPSADTLAANNGQAGHSAAVYGFAGGDSITGGPGNDLLYGGSGNDTIISDIATRPTPSATALSSEGDVYNGGAGADSIVGGATNDHIYGFFSSATVGQTGNDSSDADNLSGGAGNDYIQGNAGNDTIDGGTGNDRLFGGADNDSITGGTGNDSINGNKGDDLIFGQGDNDVIHGGQGADTIYGDDTSTASQVSGNDVLFGDLGNDSIVGGLGHDTMTGGDGADTFGFGTGNTGTVGTPVNVSDAAPGGGTTAAPALATTPAAVAAAAAAGTLTTGDEITDYVHGTDKIDLAFTVAAGGVLTQASTSAFTSLSSAEVYAQQLMDNHAGSNEVAVVSVGTDAYLFFSATGGDQIDSIVKLDGVAATTITSTDFI